MPKVSLSKNQQKTKERADNIRGLIAGEMERFGYSNKTISDKAGININTFNAKKRNIMSLTLAEAFPLMDALHIKILFERKAGPDEA